MQHMHEHMVHNLRAPRTNLDGLDPTVLDQAGVDDDVLVWHHAGGFDRLRFCKVPDLIGLPDQPAIGVGRGLRRVAGIAERFLAFQPGQQCCLLRRCE